jgi:hypothetical protein
MMSSRTTERSQELADTAVAITAIIVSGVVGPGLSAWWTRRRQRDDHEREARAELRAVLDEGANVMGNAKRCFEVSTTCIAKAWIRSRPKRRRCRHGGALQCRKSSTWRIASRSAWVTNTPYASRSLRGRTRLRLSGSSRAHTSASGPLARNSWMGSVSRTKRTTRQDRRTWMRPDALSAPGCKEPRQPHLSPSAEGPPKSVG